MNNRNRGLERERERERDEQKKGRDVKRMVRERLKEKLTRIKPPALITVTTKCGMRKTAECE